MCHHRVYILIVGLAKNQDIIKYNIQSVKCRYVLRTKIKKVVIGYFKYMVMEILIDKKKERGKPYEFSSKKKKQEIER